MARPISDQATLTTQARIKSRATTYKRKTSGGGMPCENSYVPSIPAKSEHPSRSVHTTAVKTSNMFLPTEIIINIISFIPATPASQPILYSCCLLSRQWYSATVPILYSRPYLYGKNFDPFAATICPSINAHIRKSELAELVRSLDMSHLVHHGSKSLTARLLGRTKARLEEFVAPQASFAVNCFAALAKCHNLQTLDLSLLSEAPELRTLFHTISSLPNLEVFRFPRCSTSVMSFSSADCKWPPALRTLQLSGRLPPQVLGSFVRPPRTMTNLILSHCTGTTAGDILYFLHGLSAQLTSLTLNHLPHADATLHLGGLSVLDRLLHTLPRIVHLSIDVDLISPDLFLYAPKKPHPLEFLELTKSADPPTAEAQVFPFDIHCAISERGLKNVRRIRASRSVWYPMGEGQGQELEQLADLLQTLELKDWDRESGLKVDSESKEGHESDSEEERWRREAEERWKGRKRKAGLWIFDE